MHYLDDYCWSTIRFAHALIEVIAALIQIAPTLPVLSIPLLYLLTVIPSEELIEEYYRITNNKLISFGGTPG